MPFTLILLIVVGIIVVSVGAASATNHIRTRRKTDAVELKSHSTNRNGDLDLTSRIASAMELQGKAEAADIARSIYSTKATSFKNQIRYGSFHVKRTITRTLVIRQ